MKIRLGYACISKTLDNVTSSHSYTYTNFEKEKNFKKLEEIIIKNFNDLEKLIDYNIKNNIHFYRLSPKLIPLATHKEVDFEYIKRYRKHYDKIAKKINENNMRVDIHPEEYCVLNSANKDVVYSSIIDLKYCYSLLEQFNIKNKTLILHVGGSTFGKKQGLARFINNYKKLPKQIQEAIAVENDDKIYNIDDCLKLNEILKVKIVLDYHHYLCNNEEELTLEMIKKIFDSWYPYIPKIHFSSPKNKTKKEFRSHHEFIDVDSFIDFIEYIKPLNKDIDIMIEAKGKDEALFRLVRGLKYKTNYKFIDDTTFIV